MANIRTETWRHVWVHRKLSVGFKDDWKFMLHCENCRLAWDYEERGSPPVSGCCADVRLKNLGRAAADEYRQDEERRLRQWELYQ